jgi:hypothetical protein
MSSIFVVILFSLIVLFGIYVFFRFVAWPLVSLFARLVGATWQGRSGLNPQTRPGRWRLLGLTCIVVGALLAGEARGLPILDPVMAWMNIDMAAGGAETAAGIFGLYGGFLVFALLGTRCFAYAKRFDAAPASAVFSQDSRPPVVYLRSFADDSKAANRLGLAADLKVDSEEGEIAEIVRSVGPLVAIGRPGEELSYYGAARIYVGDGDWHEHVRKLLSQAKLVIVRAGETAGLSWEIGECAKTVEPRRLIILVPLSRRGYEDFRAIAAPLFPCRLPEYTGRRVGETTLRAIVYFDADWDPHLVPIINESYLSYWLGIFANFLTGTTALDREKSEMHRILDSVLQPLIRRAA